MSKEMIVSTAKSVVKSIDWERVGSFIEKNPKEFAVVSIGAISGMCNVYGKYCNKDSVDKAIMQGKTVTIYPDGTTRIAL